MSDRARRHPRNVAGQYYVDTSCVQCRLCQDLAPGHFMQPPEEGSFVHRQPATEKEREICDMMLEYCPMGAIGNDGVVTSPPPPSPQIRTREV
ncbi:MAG: ferredoxin [Verrucomicrobiae bacterium]|nr:ferredoxin [Verrucomicrobiae bacterium]